MDRLFVCETMSPDGRLPLREILSRLRQIYCGSIGIQYMHIDDLTHAALGAGPDRGPDLLGCLCPATSSSAS